MRLSSSPYYSHLRENSVALGVCQSSYIPFHQEILPLHQPSQCRPTRKTKHHSSARPPQLAPKIVGTSSTASTKKLACTRSSAVPSMSSSSSSLALSGCSRTARPHSSSCCTSKRWVSVM